MRLWCRWSPRLPWDWLYLPGVRAFAATPPPARNSRAPRRPEMVEQSTEKRVEDARSVKMNGPVEVARGRVRLSRTGVVVAAVPGAAQPADGLAQAHWLRGYGLQALERARWQMVAVLFPVLGQQQLGIAEDAGNRIIDLVAQDFAEIAGHIVSGKNCRALRLLGQSYSALQQA